MTDSPSPQQVKEAVERLRQSLRNAAIMRTELASVWVSDARALLTALEAASGENVEQRAAAQFSAEAFDALNERLSTSNARVRALEGEVAKLRRLLTTPTGDA